MKRFATGVTLITFKHQDSFGGLTVSSFCSLSMNPPLILICIDKKIVSHETLMLIKRFGVNICNSKQGKLAWDFANSNIDSLATMECKITENYDGGDHTIFIGEVENGRFDEKGEPLVYYSAGLGFFKPD